MAENCAFIEFQLCLRWTIGQLLALCKKLGKKLEKKKWEKNSVGFLKNRHLLISDGFLKNLHFLKGGGFLKKSTPF